jgi:tRNA nucleotidyltransferase (CCA-adding enzyme)
MDVVLCHRTADFDALGAAVGWARLHPGARIVLCGGTHPAVRDFLALYRDEYPLIERRAVSPEQLSTIAVVDAQHRALLSAAADWLDLPQVQVQLYDHHIHAEGDISAKFRQVEAVGATTTLIAERLQSENLSLSMAEATVMALGIHADTGSLTYDLATVRDAAALTWLMAQGANQKAIATYTEPGFSSELQELLGEALPQLQTVTFYGYRVAWTMLSSDRYVPGLSSLTSQLMVLSESDALVLGHRYQTRSSGQDRLTVIARSRIEGVDLSALLQPIGGGGHAAVRRAASASNSAAARCRRDYVGSGAHNFARNQHRPSPSNFVAVRPFGAIGDGRGGSACGNSLATRLRYCAPPRLWACPCQGLHDSSGSHDYAPDNSAGN